MSLVSTNTTITPEILCKIHARYPDKVPVVISQVHRDLEISRTKFLVSEDVSVMQLQALIRNRITNLRPEEAIYMFISKSECLLAGSCLVLQVFEEYANEGVLEIVVTKENTFG